MTSLDTKTTALEDALHDRDPFYSGICTIPDYQRLLYYTHGGLLRRIDFSNVRADDLDALYRACKPAEFGRNGENVLDESYRKAGKMDLVSFAMLFDPRSLGIHEQVSKALLTQSYATMDMELYKLNVYGAGDFFKAHKDTPQGQNMFGSLVVVLPTPHEGGQFVLRQDKTEWTLDFSDKFTTATEPSACFVAFYSDVEHEVLPVTSGYRVTLTYNLYHKPMHPSASSIPTPYHLKLKQALVNLVNDKSILPKGGYLGFGLVHEYVHTGRKLIDALLCQLKGSDRALADVCDTLGLRYSLRLLYREIGEQELNLITTDELDMESYVDSDMDMDESPIAPYLRDALEGLTIEQVEGVVFAGEKDKFDPSLLEEDYHEYSPWLESFYRDPVTEVLELTPMKSSMNVKIPYTMIYGNSAGMEYYYGTACMLIAVEPAESRKLLGL